MRRSKDGVYRQYIQQTYSLSGKHRENTKLFHKRDTQYPDVEKFEKYIPKHSRFDMRRTLQEFII